MIGKYYCVSYSWCLLTCHPTEKPRDIYADGRGHVVGAARTSGRIGDGSARSRVDEKNRLRKLYTSRNIAIADNVGGHSDNG